jgi:UrcA family protein
MTTVISKLTTFRRSLALASAFAALTVATTSFAASQSDDPPSTAVRYGDLDLSTAAGANALYHRIANAAQLVCPNPYSRDLKTAAASRRCQADAIAQAVRELNNPQLALVYAAHHSHG